MAFNIAPHLTFGDLARQEGQQNLQNLAALQEMRVRQESLADLMRKRKEEQSLREVFAQAVQQSTGQPDIAAMKPIAQNLSQLTQYGPPTEQASQTIGDLYTQAENLPKTGLNLGMLTSKLMENPQTFAEGLKLYQLMAKEKPQLVTTYDEKGRSVQKWLRPGEQEGQIVGYGKKEGAWSDPYSLQGATVQRNLDTGEIRTAVSRAPVTNIRQEAAPTITTIQDPKNPDQQLVINAREYQGGTIGSKGVIGVSGKLGDIGKENLKKQVQHAGIGELIADARGLLSGTTTGTMPTGSGVGAAYDVAAGIIGASPSGAAEADSLKVIGGALVGKVPRFEGPQSDKDTALYKQMAANIGDSTIPVNRRLSALQSLENIMQGYEDGSRGRILAPGAKPSTQPSQPNQVILPKVGEVRKGYVFLGGDPSDKNRWRKQ